MTSNDYATSPRVCIVLVNWNGKKDTLACLESLANDAYGNKEIIVVDNGSTDDSVLAIAAAFPSVTLIEAKTNLGFTGGNNVGIRHALQNKAEFVYLLNNDTTVEPEATGALVCAAAANAQFGLLMPVIYYYDHPSEPWFVGSSLNLQRGIALHRNDRLPDKLEDPKDIPWASGCAMFVRAELMARIGGLDNRFFIFWEDIDFSLQVLRLGFRAVIVPQAKIYHKVSRSAVSSTKASRYYHVRNSLLLVKKHAKAAYGRAAARIIVARLRECARAMLAGKVPPWHSLPVTIQAVFDHIRGRYGRYVPSRYLS